MSLYRRAPPPGDGQGASAPSVHVASPPGSSFADDSDAAELKRRVEDLQERVSELEAQLDQRSLRLRLQGKLKPVAFLFSMILLSAIPSLLVFLDRWSGAPLRWPKLGEAWGRFGFLQHTVFPPYFAIAWAACLVLGALVLAATLRVPRAVDSGVPGFDSAGEPDDIEDRQARMSRILLTASFVALFPFAAVSLARHSILGWGMAVILVAHVSGWVLREVSWQRFVGTWRANRSWLTAFGIFQFALLNFLALYNSARGFPWLAAILLIPSFFLALQYRRQINPVLWVITLAIVLYTIRIDAWWFSAIGDEFSFFSFAREIAQRYDVWDVARHLFDGGAVYGTHPFLASLLQSVFMKLMGVNNFAWRLSSLYLTALSIGFLFYFLKTFVDRKTALVASFFLAASHYVMSFGKIGYDNLQALLALTLAMAAAAWAVRTRRVLAFACVGLALGLCFYVYPAALYALPIPILVLLFYAPPTSRKALNRWGAMSFSLITLIFPLLLQPSYWKNKIPGTFLYDPRLVQSTGTLLTHFASNLLYALFAFLYVPSETHFVTASLLDPITSALALVGILRLLGKALRRERFALFWVASFAMMLLLVGASHDRAFPPNTRMFLLLPWYCSAAAIGVLWLLESLRRLEVFRVRPQRVLAALIAAVIGLNLYQAYVVSPRRLTGLQSLETLFLRLAGRAETVRPSTQQVYLFLVTPEWGIDGIRVLQSVYALPPSDAQLVSTVVSGEQLTEATHALIAKPDTLVIVHPKIDRARQRSLGIEIAALGKSSCAIRNTIGDFRFTLWHDPVYKKLCQP